MFRVKQVNKETVEPVKFDEKQTDKRPVKGANIFPDVYCNIFCCARKKSGKTSAIAKIIESCSTSETSIIAFVSTLHRDNTWRAIEDMCQKKDIPFHGFTSIKDVETKEDILEKLLKELGEPGTKEDVDKAPDTNPVRMGGGDQKQKKKKKPKEQAPKIIFIFDDLSGELLSPSIAKLLKHHRHYKCKTIISSQYWNDIILQGRMQIDYVLLYQGLGKSIDKMKDIYHNLSLSVDFETFMELYSFATAERFHFLYISVVDSTFRRDFTHQIDLSEERIL